MYIVSELPVSHTFLAMASLQSHGTGIGPEPLISPPDMPPEIAPLPPSEIPTELPAEIHLPDRPDENNPISDTPPVPTSLRH